MRPWATPQRVGIVVARDFPDLDQVRAFVRALPPETVLVVGGSRQVDRVAAVEAEQCGLTTETVAPDRQSEGARVAYALNLEIAKRVDRLVIFGDSFDQNIRRTINVARDRGVLVDVRRPD